MVVLGGTTTPILFQWLVSRDVLIGPPFIILIFTSLLLVLVYVHFRGFICSMNKTERIILVRARPILLPNIIRKSSPQTRAKNAVILFFISYFIAPIPQDVNGLPNQSLSIKNGSSSKIPHKCH
jgi:cytochrome c biogenesis factor